MPRYGGYRLHDKPDEQGLPMPESSNSKQPVVNALARRKRRDEMTEDKSESNKSESEDWNLGPRLRGPTSWGWSPICNFLRFCAKVCVWGSVCPLG